MLFEYSGVKYERSFATITFNADLYRRFGWMGVILGNIILGILYGLIVKNIFSISRNKQILRAMMVIFFVGMFRSLPIGTLQRTCWYWLWEIPKYMVLLLLIYYVLTRYLEVKRYYTADSSNGANIQ
jgi:hypothetical protein